MDYCTEICYIFVGFLSETTGNGMISKCISFFKRSLIGQIVIGLIIGTLAGVFIPQAGFIGLFGTAFVGALKAIAPVLVLFLVMSAIIEASGKKAGKFRRILFLYLFSTLVSAVFAVFICFLFPVKMHFLEVEIHPVLSGLNEIASAVLTNLLEEPVQSLMNANYISILVWAVIFGIALKKQRNETTTEFIHQIAGTLTTVVRWIISFAPVGIMGIIFTTVSKHGLSIFEDYSRLRVILTVTMISVALIVNPLIVFFIMRRNPYPLVFKCLKESGITAFFTRSSAANIPVNMQLCENLNLDKEVYSFFVPLGATINMNGAAITITVMTLMTLHTLGIDFTFFSAIMVSCLAALAACGAAGVAGGSILLIPLALSMFGIENEVATQVVAVGFTLGVLQDALETALNSSGDVLFIAASEFRDLIKKGENLPDLKKTTSLARVPFLS